MVDIPHSFISTASCFTCSLNKFIHIYIQEFNLLEASFFPGQWNHLPDVVSELDNLENLVELLILAN